MYIQKKIEFRHTSRHIGPFGRARGQNVLSRVLGLFRMTFSCPQHLPPSLDFGYPVKMDPGSLGRFTGEHFFGTPETLMLACIRLQGGGRSLLRFHQSLRIRHVARKTIAQIKAARAKRTRPRWYNALARQLFQLYMTLRRQAAPRAKMPAEDGILHDLSKAQRRHLSGFYPGIRNRQVSTEQRATKATQRVWRTMRNRWGVVWLDNWQRHRYGVNPLNVDLSLYGSGLAYLPLPDIPRDFPMHLTHTALAAQVPLVARGLRQWFTGTLRRKVQDLVSTPVTLQEVRSPCDIKREDVKPPGWRPLDLSVLKVGSSEDFVNLVATVLEYQVHSTHTMPLLVDVDLYYRCMKMMYSKNDLKYRALEKFDGLPPVFGVWHAYKYCCEMVHRTFFPWFSVIMNPMCLLDAELKVYAKPKLRQIERMLVAFLVAGAPLVDAINRKLASAAPATTARGKYDRAVLGSLKTLLSEYVPACFYLGFLVRQCNWASMTVGTGVNAYKALQTAMWILVGLTHPNEDKIMYVRTIAVALLAWQPWYDDLPGMTFSEEFCEAMLGILSTRALKNPNQTSLYDTGNLFLCITRSEAVKDLHRTGVGQALVTVVKQQLTIRINRSLTEELPWYRWGIGGPLARWKVVQAPVWDVAYVWPLSLWAPEIDACLEDLLHKSLRTLFRSAPRPANVANAMTTVFGLQTEGLKAAFQKEIRDFNRANPIAARYKRTARVVNDIIDVVESEDEAE
jgi:hypothetical protein